MSNLLLAWVCLGISSAALTVGCAQSCDDLQSEAAELKEELEPCSGDEACVNVTVANECLGGALGCGFTVPASKEDEARDRAAVIAEKSLSCNPCAMADCAARGAPVCDATQGRCVYTTP